VTAAYYNEIDPNAAEWLRQNIRAGIIADGEVDERSITEVKPDDLQGFTQCHFFAGIGGWSYALRASGWPDDRPVWTGSCPCQPFSAAGKGKGVKDERHLWPEIFRLIRECRPGTVLGEQVAGKAGESWFDIVLADLAREKYAAAPVVFSACSLGAPHLRKRLYWMAHALQGGRGQDGIHAGGSTEAAGAGASDGSDGEGTGVNGVPAAGPTNGFWGPADWLFCRDGKWRPVEPGTFPLVNGSPSELLSDSDLSIQDIANTAEARTMRLKGYGNAIVAPQAIVFCETVREILDGVTHAQAKI
jgi:DNA (cytosine-5)-methyltransferase 1